MQQVPQPLITLTISIQYNIYIEWSSEHRHTLSYVTLRMIASHQNNININNKISASSRTSHHALHYPAVWPSLTRLATAFFMGLASIMYNLSEFLLALKMASRYISSAWLRLAQHPTCGWLHRVMDAWVVGLNQDRICRWINRNNYNNQCYNAVIIM